MDRAFIAEGAWRGGAEACDAASQQRATLRVSALAGAITLALLAGPDLRPASSPGERARLPAVASPELMSFKPADRVPSAEPASAWRRVRPAEIEPPKEAPAAGLEIVDARTLRSGAMTVRIAGLVLPAGDRACRRLDGLAVACVSRAESYLELLVRGRAVACERAGPDADGVERGRCRIGEVDIAEQMVRQGWAEAADGEPRLTLAEAQAKRQRLGIWRE